MGENYLEDYAWSEFFAEAKKKSLHPDLSHGRVISVHKTKYELITEKGNILADIIGNLQFQKDPLKKPAVGDWVLYEKKKDTFVIREILKRKTLLKRQKKHDSFPKAIAANIDRAIIIQSAYNDFSVKRLERILVHINEAKIIPLLIINKIDLVDEKEMKQIKEDLENITSRMEVFYTSLSQKEGLSFLERELKERETIILIGSSGVGKSTLINYLLGDNVQETKEISSFSGKGKHTTTARRMLRLKNGVLLIDTPGTREFGMHQEENQSLKESFDMVDTYAAFCRFNNCNHEKEKDCAVRKALNHGKINRKSYEHYLLLLKEMKQSPKQMRQSSKQSSKKRIKKSIPRSFRRGK